MIRKRSNMLCFKGVSKIRPLMIPIRPLKIVHLLPEVLLALPSPMHLLPETQCVGRLWLKQQAARTMRHSLPMEIR
jgi:hypothetical protein